MRVVWEDMGKHQERVWRQVCVGVGQWVCHRYFSHINRWAEGGKDHDGSRYRYGVLVCIVWGLGNRLVVVRQGSGKKVFARVRMTKVRNRLAQSMRCCLKASESCEYRLGFYPSDTLAA